MIDVLDERLESSLLEGKKARASLARKFYLMLLGNRAPALVLTFCTLVSMLTGYVNSAALAGAMHTATDTENPLPLLLLLSGVVAFGFLAICSPLAGWVVDTHCGRYRGIRCSLWLLASPLLAASIALLVFVGAPPFPPRTLDISKAGYAVLACVAAVGAVPLGVGILVFKSSVVQFGTDQLTEITPQGCSLFLHCLLWADCVGRALPELYAGTLYPASLPITGWLGLFYGLSAVLFVAVLLECCCFGTWLAKEPKVENPYQLLLSVLRSSLGPRDRAAEIGRIPRIDSVKTDYGGKFSAVEVERVKIALAVTRMSVLFAVAGGLSVSSSTVLPLLSRLMRNGGDILTLPQCTNGTNCSSKSVTVLLFGSGNFSTILLALFIPLLCPLLASRAVSVKFAISKFGGGLVLLIASIVCSLLTDVIGSAELSEGRTPTAACLLRVRSNITAESLAAPVQLTIIQDVLNALSYLLTFTSSLEFILLQSPRCMKGMTLCLFYSFQGFCAILGTVVAFVFYGLSGNQPPSCNFWYFVVNLAISIVVMTLLIICAKRYKPSSEINVVFWPDKNFVTSTEQLEIDHELGLL